jgi:hypothetical protein
MFKCSARSRPSSLSSPFRSTGVRQTAALKMTPVPHPPTPSQQPHCAPIQIAGALRTAGVSPAPLTFSTLILHHPLPILVVVHPNLPHELHRISLPQFQQQPAQRHLLAPLRHPHQRLHRLASMEKSLFMLFAATSLPHLQQQFLSLLTLLRAAICTTKNKKGAPISRSALRIQCSSGL